MGLIMKRYKFEISFHDLNWIQHFQVRKDEIPDDEAFDRRVLEDLDYKKALGRELKSYTDETQAPRQRVTTERITVSKRDITRGEQPEKIRYPKDLDIGRIVIEEIPEEKEVIPKRESPHEGRIKPKTRETTETREVTEVPRKNVIEQETKLYKEWTSDYEQRPWERRTVDERVTTYTDRVDGVYKVR